MKMSDVRANRSLSTSIDSALDDDHVNFLLRDHQVKVHSVDLSGEQIQHEAKTINIPQMQIDHSNVKPYVGPYIRIGAHI